MNFNADSPIYLQIVRSFESLIDKGAYQDGDPLPSVRETAVSMNVNPNTVARSFQVLVEDGYAISLPKKGYFAKKGGKDIRMEELSIEIHSLLKRGYSKEEIIEVLNKEGK